MSRMLWYEWKRIWQSRLTQLAVIGCGIFLVFCVWSGIVQMTAVDMNGNQVSGMQAAEVLQDTQERITLDKETVNKLLEEYISYTEDPQTGSDDPDLLYLSEEIYRTWYLPRQELFRIIGGIYIKPENVQESVGDTLKKSVGVDFYEARSERLMERLTTLYQNGTITAEEADWWVEKDESVDEYIFGYSKAWQQILTTGSWIVLIMVIVCVGIAPVFAGSISQNVILFAIYAFWKESFDPSEAGVIISLYKRCILGNYAAIFCSLSDAARDQRLGSSNTD